MGRRVWHKVTGMPAAALALLVRAYQVTISPLLGPRCKYYPSCSNYALGALRQHGALRGTRLALWRLLRCNPWSDGGVDDVPPPKRRRPEPLTLRPIEP